MSPLSLDLILTVLAIVGWALAFREWRLRAKWAERFEAESIRHAGCLTAAEGCYHGDLKPGDWAWSPALQAVYELRKERDQLADVSVRGV
jgi:hypothetical protein